MEEQELIAHLIRIGSVDRRRRRKEARQQIRGNEFLRNNGSISEIIIMIKRHQRMLLHGRRSSGDEQCCLNWDDQFADGNGGNLHCQFLVQMRFFIEIMCPRG